MQSQGMHMDAVTMTDIEESGLDTAPIGLYRVLRAGEVVRTRNTCYNATSDQWLVDVPLVLLARVSDPRPDGWLPVHDHVSVRADGKVLVKSYELESV